MLNIKHLNLFMDFFSIFCSWQKCCSFPLKDIRGIRLHATFPWSCFYSSCFPREAMYYFNTNNASFSFFFPFSPIFFSYCPLRATYYFLLWIPGLYMWATVCQVRFWNFFFVCLLLFMHQSLKEWKQLANSVIFFLVFFHGFLNIQLP